MIDTLRGWLRRARFYLRRRDFDRELREELAFHLEAKAGEFAARGHDPAAARTLAARQIGRASAIAEEARDVWAFRQIDLLLQDLRYAIRSIRRGPGFAAVVIGVIGLGLGGITVIASVASTALFRPLPIRDPNSLRWVLGTQQFGRSRSLSYAEVMALRTDRATFNDVIAYQDLTVALGGPGAEPARASGLLVSGNYFSALGAELRLGRGFAPEEDSVPGANSVAVVSEALWIRRYGADSSIVGRPIVIDGRQFTVVGVARAGFVGLELESTPDVWVPLAMQRALMPGSPTLLEDPTAWWLRVAVRLGPGIGDQRALAAARVAHARVASAHAKLFEETSVSLGRVQGGLIPPSRAEAFSIIGLMLLVPGLVLLIACANVANLLLARAASRQREIGVRLSLGASRSRLIRQVLTESSVLGIGGGLLGLLLAALGTPLLLRAVEAPPEFARSVLLDWRVFGFTGGASLLAGLLFGLAPALGASRSTATRIRGEWLSVGGVGGRSRTMRWLVISEVAGSLILLVTSALFVRSLDKALAVDPGFDITGVTRTTFDLALQGYDAERRDAFYRTLLDRVRQLPSVEAAALATFLPLSDRLGGGRVHSPGDGREQDEPTLLASVWPGYLGTIGLPLVAGRDFDSRDGLGAPRVAIVNQTLASRLWPGRVAVGQDIVLAGDSVPWQVIGVTRDAKYDDLSEDPRGYLMLPERQSPQASGIDLVVRTRGDETALLTELRALFHELDPNLPLFAQQSFKEMVRGRLDGRRGAAKAITLFGVLALGLAGLGLYGVMSFAVVQRNREIGIRLAIGAAPGGIARLFLSEAAWVAARGIVLGLGLSVVVSLFLRRFLFGLEWLDAVALVGSAAFLLVVALVASYLPARRGSELQPTVVLRSD